MIRRSICAVRTDLAGVLGFLTRLPVGPLMPRDPVIDMARAVWVFPLAGALAGACGGVVLMFGAWIGLASLLSACWSLGAMLLLTGGLHEDGLADMLDGFGGGRDREHKLAIMRDSRIGSYGALGIGLSSLLRVTAAASLATPVRACAGLIAAGTLSRAAIVLLLLVLTPARKDGLAAPLHPLPRLPACIALAIALTLAGLLLPGAAALAAGFGTVIAVLALAALARRQIGGHTGDVLGACSVAAECVVLTILAAC